MNSCQKKKGKLAKLVNLAHTCCVHNYIFDNITRVGRTKGTLCGSYHSVPKRNNRWGVHKKTQTALTICGQIDAVHLEQVVCANHTIFFFTHLLWNEAR